MMVKRVAVVVLNWNGWKDTISCVESLQQLDYPDFWLIVVDNASSDDSVTRIKAAMPDGIVCSAHETNPLPPSNSKLPIMNVAIH